jgi:aryl-alcohol dehydrogenase-like predicted oxidoreductase
MQTVTLGATRLEVTPIAYGTWQFGGDWGPVDEQAAIAAIGHARSQGINFFDTAQAYGFGRSERLLGTALAADLRSARESDSPAQIDEFTAVLLVETVQPPYHLFRRDIEADLLPYAKAHDIGVLAYGPLAHGLLGGAVTGTSTFGAGDWRSHSPAFTGDGFRRNLQVVAALGRFAADRGATIAQLAVAWVLAHPAVQVAIVGAPTPAHLAESLGAVDLALGHAELAEIDQIMAAAVPVGGPTPEGMA